MITIDVYAYVSNKWTKQANYTRPVSGSNKLDETLDSAVLDFTKQATENQLPPFTKIKVVANDGTTTQTEYFVNKTSCANSLTKRIFVGMSNEQKGFF